MLGNFDLSGSTTEEPIIEYYDNHILSVKTSNETQVSGLTTPVVPYPFRKDNPDIQYINSSALMSKINELMGTGDYKGHFITHDIFMNGGEVCQLTSQLNYLCRIIMQSDIEVHEEEIIYKPITEISFDYYCPVDGTVLSHAKMMMVVEEVQKQTGKKFKEVEDYFHKIDATLQSSLEKNLLGIYPREIWGKFDMICVGKK